MKTLPETLQAHLATGVTTLCWCWKLTRNDALVQGFTDHDRPLTIAGTLYEAATGFTASEVQSSLGLAVDNLTVGGALSSASLNESDLAAGLYDDAEVEIWRVNWADTTQRVLMRKGNLGEVQRGPSGFQAELRGLAHRLNQPLGRAYGYSCDADLGDARCTVTLDAATGLVTTASDNRRFTMSGLESFTNGWFTGGKLTWTSGANETRAMEIKRHGIADLELWQAMSETIATGDTFSITPGCDKQFTTCKSKFANAANFRGFPYMPGNDAAISTVAQGQTLNGGSRYGN